MVVALLEEYNARCSQASDKNGQKVVQNSYPFFLSSVIETGNLRNWCFAIAFFPNSV